MPFRTATRCNWARLGKNMSGGSQVDNIKAVRLWIVPSGVHSYPLRQTAKKAVLLDRCIGICQYDSGRSSTDVQHSGTWLAHRISLLMSWSLFSSEKLFHCRFLLAWMAAMLWTSLLLDHRSLLDWVALMRMLARTTPMVAGRIWKNVLTALAA